MNNAQQRTKPVMDNLGGKGNEKIKNGAAKRKTWVMVAKTLEGGRELKGTGHWRFAM